MNNWKMKVSWVRRIRTVFWTFLYQTIALNYNDFAKTESADEIIFWGCSRLSALRENGCVEVHGCTLPPCGWTEHVFTILLVSDWAENCQWSHLSLIQFHLIKDAPLSSSITLTHLKLLTLLTGPFITHSDRFLFKRNVLLHLCSF